MKNQTIAEREGRPVLVTTAHRGVFFGWTAQGAGNPTIALKGAQLVIYWSADLRGFMGLASHGPSGSCKIGRPADIELREITSVVECTEEAVKRFEKFAR